MELEKEKCMCLVFFSKLKKKTNKLRQTNKTKHPHKGNKTDHLLVVCFLHYKDECP